MFKGIGLFAGLTIFLAGTALAETVAPGDVTISDDLTISKSLTGMAGDPVAGRKVFANRKQGNCLACHANKDLSEQLFHGEIGPPLDGVAERWNVEQFRAIVTNAKVVFSDATMMPGFYSLEVGEDVAKKFVGKTILTAQQVEDVVAYLTTLK
ncbi:MAG: sulfur oxidation c-type cytochrome SoxX [Halocynthiibacter sp.]